MKIATEILKQVAVGGFATGVVIVLTMTNVGRESWDSNLQNTVALASCGVSICAGAFITVLFMEKLRSRSNITAANFILSTLIAVGCAAIGGSLHSILRHFGFSETFAYGCLAAVFIPVAIIKLMLVFERRRMIDRIDSR